MRLFSPLHHVLVMGADAKPIIPHRVFITSVSADCTAATSPVMTNEPLKRSTKPMDTLADLVAIGGDHGCRLTGGDGKDPNGAGGVDQSQLQVQILGGVGDHMGQGDLLAGYKFLYNPLFLIKLNQIGTLLLKPLETAGCPPIMPQGRAAYPA